jgi:transposase
VNKITRIGMDTSKSVFQLHGVDEKEMVVLRRREVLAFFAKPEPTVIGLEACGAAHYWARELTKLGHEAVLIPPQHVKAYVAQGRKNDAADAEAICEAMSRPKVQKRFVAVKTEDRQAEQMLMGAREGLVRRRTQLTNTIRGYAAEFGLIAAKGLDKIEPLLARIAAAESLPQLAREMFVHYGRELAALQGQMRALDARLLAWHRSNELSRRLVKVPTIGPIGACLFAIKVTDPKAFESSRAFAAWLGVTPKDHSTAGKMRHGGITRAGDEALRSQLVVGATALIRQAKNGRSKPSPWLENLIARKPPKLAAVALANKTARIIWKLMVSGESYDTTRAWTAAADREGRCATLVEGSAPRPSLRKTRHVVRTAMPMNP